jgi:hypothetical protein
MPVRKQMNLKLTPDNEVSLNILVGAPYESPSIQTLFGCTQFKVPDFCKITYK